MCEVARVCVCAFITHSSHTFFLSCSTSPTLARPRSMAFLRALSLSFALSLASLSLFRFLPFSCSLSLSLCTHAHTHSFYWVDKHRDKMNLSRSLACVRSLSRSHSLSHPLSRFLSAPPFFPPSLPPSLSTRTYTHNEFFWFHSKNSGQYAL